MSFFGILDISASGLNSQRMRMNVIASNIANVNVTRTPDGGPYKRKDVVFQTKNIDSFKDALSNAIMGQGVEVTEVYDDTSPFILKYEPNHPDADAEGYVSYPNINIVEEMTNMVSASRSFEANVMVIEASKGMALKALQI
jgi:flagellar basal-body rod protein FlgC